MTPTEIQAAVESALANKVILPWWSYLISVLIVAGGAYFGVYLKEKGRNLATREDIKDITDKIEKVRSDYRKEKTDTNCWHLDYSKNGLRPSKDFINW